MKRKATIGSISTGTLRPADLIPVFADELRRLRGSLPRQLYDDMRKLREGADDEAPEVLDSLHEALADYAPAWCTFGAHPGDGADFGFWPDIEGAREDSDVLKVSDTGDVPLHFNGEVLHVNDHGNVTLYASKNGALTEIWAVV